ncbi:hypothetical protein D3C77_406840 [compost metagenome]
MKLVSGIQLSAGLIQALVDHILNCLQLGLSAKCTNALDLVSLDGETLWQMHGVERQQDSFASANDQPGCAALSCRDQGQLVAVLFDLHSQGRNALLLKQPEAGQAARYQLLLVDGGGQCSNTESVVLKNGDISHVYSLQKVQTPLKTGLGNCC